MPTLGPGETASMHQPSALLLDPTRPPGGTDVQPSRHVAQHPPQHPQRPGGTGVGEVGCGMKRCDEVLGLTAAGRGCREFERSAELSRQHPAQNALPMGNEREPAEVSCVDLYDKGEGSLLQSQAFRGFSVEDLRHQPEIWFNPTRPFARSGGERPAADGVGVPRAYIQKRQVLFFDQAVLRRGVRPRLAESASPRLVQGWQACAGLGEFTQCPVSQLLWRYAQILEPGAGDE